VNIFPSNIGSLAKILQIKNKNDIKIGKCTINKYFFVKFFMKEINTPTTNKISIIYTIVLFQTDKLLCSYKPSDIQNNNNNVGTINTIVKNIFDLIEDFFSAIFTDILSVLLSCIFFKFFNIFSKILIIKFNIDYFFYIV
jgi:hypothetical protein